MGILWASFGGKLKWVSRETLDTLSLSQMNVDNMLWLKPVRTSCPMFQCSNLFSSLGKFPQTAQTTAHEWKTVGVFSYGLKFTNGQCPFIHNERSLRVFLVWLTLTWLTCFNSRWRNISRLKNQTVSHPQGLRIHIPLWRRILGQFCTESNINRKMRRGRGRGGNVGERFRPNVFLAIYVNNPNLVAGISEVQDECVRRQPRLAPHRDAVPAARSHVSLLAARWNRSIWKLEKKTIVR